MIVSSNTTPLALENSTTRTNCTYGSDYYCMILINVRRSLGIVSIIGTIFVILLIFLLKRYTLLVQRLILYLTISALFDGIGYTIGKYDLTEGFFCTFQGAWLQFFDWMVVVWMCNITANLTWNVVFMRPTNRWFEVFYLSVSFVVPLFFACLPFINDSYGPAGLWCWIDNETVLEKVFRFVTWYIPTYIIVFLMFAVYLMIICRVTMHIRSYDPTNPYSSIQRELLKKEIYPLMKYPCVYLLLNLFPLVNRIQDAIVPKHPIFILALLQAVSSPLLGLCLALVFALDTQTIKELKWSNLKVHVSTCCRKVPQMEEYDVYQGATDYQHEHSIHSNLSEHARLIVDNRHSKVI
ncbi:Cyclic AMP receptor-like protein A-like isoform X2 [Oopsacas minuta]|uniref:Cyclic AMP receptor-like protein A-like isoform X2 n=1 Tax=Oopsacas minuta TaxID=111878 RepID=A0AAV7K5E2_9METZ|nr:Cyclic AMP receptor-like protein A-like isoform X2 [Oopsacas minuta]